LVAAFGAVFGFGVAVAGDEVCIVNITSTPVDAGSRGSAGTTIVDDAFCITVDLANDNPTLEKDGQGIWVQGTDGTKIEVVVFDPFTGPLEFYLGYKDFGGVDVPDGLWLSAAEKGEDGVYRMFVQENTTGL
jgi:hypothetical protein